MICLNEQNQDALLHYVVFWQLYGETNQTSEPMVVNCKDNRNTNNTMCCFVLQSTARLTTCEVGRGIIKFDRGQLGFYCGGYCNSARDVQCTLSHISENNSAFMPP